MKKRINLFKAMAEGYIISWKNPIKSGLGTFPVELKWTYKSSGQKKDAE